jgi:hypothetical protein
LANSSFLDRTARKHLYYNHVFALERVEQGGDDELIYCSPTSHVCSVSSLTTHSHFSVPEFAASK